MFNQLMSMMKATMRKTKEMLDNLTEGIEENNSREREKRLEDLKEEKK